jgi:hypothetical protein
MEERSELISPLAANVSSRIQETHSRLESLLSDIQSVDNINTETIAELRNLVMQTDTGETFIA